MNQTPLTWLFLCLILLILFQESFSYTNLGVSIADLESMNSTGFNAEAAGWTVSDPWNGIVYQTLASGSFSAMYVLGGPKSLGTLWAASSGEYFQRIYTGISPHTFLHFTATFWIFDQLWAIQVPADLYFDGSIVSIPKVKSISDLTMQFGGNDNTVMTGRDLGFDHIYAGISHTGSTLTFRVISKGNLDFNNLAFGFRDINLLFSNYAGTVTTCHRSEVISTLGYDQCPCNPGQAFNTSSSNCEACATGCKTCFGIDKTECLKCESTTYWTGSECYVPSPPSNPSGPIVPIGPIGPSNSSNSSNSSSSSGSGSQNNKKIEASNPVASTAGKIGSNSARVMAIIRLQSASLFSILGLSEMMQYVRYLKIAYPAKLLRLFQSLYASPLSLPLNINMPEGLSEDLPDRELPAVFEYYELSSSFLMNYWDTLISLVIVFGSVIILFFLSLWTKNSKKMNSLTKKLLKMVKWNLFLTYFCSSFGEIMFFGILDLRTSKFDSALEILTLVLILAAFAGVIAVIIKSLMIVLARKKEKSCDVKGFESYEALFEGCKVGSFMQLFYMTALFLREILSGTVIAGFDGVPLLQAIMLVLFSLVMSFYSIFCRPLEDLLELVITIINEILLLVVNVCVLIYVILDQQESVSEDIRDIMAEIIINISTIFTICAIVFMAVQLVILLFGIYKKLKAMRAKGITSIGQILKKVFEELTVEEEERKPQGPHSLTIEPIREMNRSQFSQEIMLSNVTNTELNLTENTDNSPSIMRSRPGQANRRQKLNSNLRMNQSPNSRISQNRFQQGPRNYQKNENLSNYSFENNNTENSFSREIGAPYDHVGRKKISRIQKRPQNNNFDISNQQNTLLEASSHSILPPQVEINNQGQQTKSIRMPINNMIPQDERRNNHQVPRRRGGRIKFPGNGG